MPNHLSRSSLQNAHTLFDHSFARELPKLCVPYAMQPFTDSRWLKFNHELALELGLDAEYLAGPFGLAVFSGQTQLDGTYPVAQAYAGHQFGGFSPRLGDGRALLLGEMLTPQGQRFDLGLKGSGRTIFARGGDGLAAVGPMLREYLISEAMHALGIPTTRSLAVLATGEAVRRERLLPGALLCRVAASHLRVGTFEYLAAQGDTAGIKALLKYALERHYPERASSENPALTLLEAVIDRQAALIARWMGVGFIHGVMNTDNMTISGETIDYGPCAFMEAHNPASVFSSIDQHGRYAYGNQPSIAQWNLARFAETLLPLIDSNDGLAVEKATEAISAFDIIYTQYWLQELRAKLGLSAVGEDDFDLTLGQDFLNLLHAHQVDHTLGFRLLARALHGQEAELESLFKTGEVELQAWLTRWRLRLQMENKSVKDIVLTMDSHNPLVIPRNHKVEEALQAASDSGNLNLFENLLEAISHPTTPPLDASYAEPATLDYTQGYRTFCGT